MPNRSVQSERERRRGGDADTGWGGSRKNEGERVEEDLREGGERLLVTLQQPSRHALHAKNCECTGLACKAAGRRRRRKKRGREGDSEVSLNRNTVCRWL